MLVSPSARSSRRGGDRPCPLPEGIPAKAIAFSVRLWVFLQGVLFRLKDVLKEKYDVRRMAVGMRAPTYWGSVRFLTRILVYS
jgi:hypothetical protein